MSAASSERADILTKKLKGTDIVPKKDRHLCRDDGDDHDNEQGDRREAGEQADNDQQPTYCLNTPYERPHEVRVGNAYSGEPPSSENLGEKQLLQTFRKEHDKADEETDQNNPYGFARAKHSPPDRHQATLRF